jgi:hypothetical protein
MVEAQGCPDLVAKATERWLVGQTPAAGGQAPMKQESWGKAWVVKPQGLNNHGLV